jgi:hypothetical protein
VYVMMAFESAVAAGSDLKVAPLRFQAMLFAPSKRTCRLMSLKCVPSCLYSRRSSSFPSIRRPPLESADLRKCVVNSWRRVVQLDGKQAASSHFTSRQPTRRCPRTARRGGKVVTAKQTAPDEENRIVSVEADHLGDGVQGESACRHWESSAGSFRWAWRPLRQIIRPSSRSRANRPPELAKSKHPHRRAGSFPQTRPGAIDRTARMGWDARRRGPQPARPASGRLADREIGCHHDRGRTFLMDRHQWPGASRPECR